MYVCKHCAGRRLRCSSKRCSAPCMKRLRMSLFTMCVCVQEEDRELRCSGCEERSVRAHAAQPSFSSTLHQQQAQQYFDLITDIFCSQNTVYLSHNSSQQLKTNILLFSLIFLFTSQFFYNCVDKILVLIWYIDQTQAFLQKGS